MVTVGLYYHPCETSPGLKRVPAASVHAFIHGPTQHFPHYLQESYLLEYVRTVCQSVSLLVSLLGKEQLLFGLKSGTSNMMENAVTVARPASLHLDSDKFL